MSFKIDVTASSLYIKLFTYFNENTMFESLKSWTQRDCKDLYNDNLKILVLIYSLYNRSSYMNENPIVLCSLILNLRTFLTLYSILSVI